MATYESEVPPQSSELSFVQTWSAPAAIVVACLAAAITVLTVTLPPVLDFPNHLTRIWLIGGGANAMRINTEETPSWGFGFGGAVLMDPALAELPMAAGTWKWGGVYGHRWYVDPVHRLTVAGFTNTAIEGMTGRFASDLTSEVYASFAPE
ncbi:MAG: hypothetical protein KGJ78_18755 [Alphaproteobacteria bacterium]|nr:hypothetical protein [Alphaproteobacteria bacterium]